MKSTQTLRVVIGLFLAFAMSGKMWAQSSNSRFVAEGAVHEYLEEDRVQTRANAFIYEGKFEEYRKWQLHIKKESRKMEEAFKKKMKKIKDEDVRDSLYEEYKRQRYDFVYQPCPYPQHEYVVIIRPTLKPTRGFAVEKDKVVYMDYNKLESGPLNISATEISEDVCMALRSLMDNRSWTAPPTASSTGISPVTWLRVMGAAETTKKAQHAVCWRSFPRLPSRKMPPP